MNKKKKKKMYGFLFAAMLEILKLQKIANRNKQKLLPELYFKNYTKNNQAYLVATTFYYIN